MPAKSTKTCLSCDEELRGRTDKKFCSDQCRNIYHNELNNQQNKFVKTVNSILKKNRKILEDLNTTGKVRLHKSKLAAMSFNFNYHTNIYRTSGGNTYYFCYEQGYLAMEKDYYMLVIKKDFIV